MAIPFEFLDDLDPLVRGVLAGVGRSTRPPKRPALSPVEQESILANALSGIMSGVEWVGETLDKSFGGRTVRAMLDDGIDASDFAHLIPFSDTLGLTDRGLLGENLLADKTQVADPSEFRERLGWTTDKWWLDVPIDIGIGVATDPGILLTGPGKALTKLGLEATQQGARVAKGLSFTDEIAQAGKSAVLGTSPAKMAEEIRAGQRGLIGIKIPFTEEPLVVFGAGSDRAAGLVEALAYNPVSAGIRQLFDTRVRGIYDPVAQKAADLLHSKTIDTSGQILDQTLAIRKRTSELEDEYNHTVKTWMEERPDVFQAISGGLPIEQLAQMDADQFIRAIGEMQAKGGAGRLRGLVDELDGVAKEASANSASVPTMITRKMREQLAAMGVTPEQMAKLTPQQAWDILGGAQGASRRTSEEMLGVIGKFDEVADAARNLQDDTYNLYKSLGGDIDHLADDFTEHFHRRISDELKSHFPKGKALERAADGVTGAIHRAIRNVKGGTFKVNAMTRDPSITGWGGDVTKVLPVEQVEAMLAKGWDDKQIREAALAAAARKVELKYGIARNPVIDEKTGAQLIDDAGKPVFDKTPEEMAGWLSRLPPKVLETGLFGRSFITDMTDYTLNMQRRVNGLDAAFRLMAEVADENALGPTVAELLGKTGKVQRYKDKAGKWRSKKEEGLLNVTDQGVQTFASRYAKKKGIDPAQVDINNLAVPETFADAAERFMHYNTKPKELHGLLGAYDRALGLVKGSLYTPWPASHVRNGVSGLWQNAVTAFKNPAQGARALREAAAAMNGKGNKEWLDAYKAYGLLDGGILDDIRTVERGLNAEVPFSNSTVVSELLGGVKDIASNIRHPIQTAKNLATEGGSEFAPFKAGRKIGEAIEFINRYSHFAALKERGWSNAAAARSVKLAHFDYNDLTSAERTVFKRLFTFYTFMRKNLPAQLRNLIDEPGGRTAQTIRGINIARETAQDKNEGSYIPSYLSEGLAIPLGPQVGNDRNFLVSRGLLPVEEAFNRFPFFDGLPDWLHTAENIGAATTPAFSAPMQAMSGRQWWSHRDLDDLYQTPTDNELLNHWLYSSPVSRVLTTERTWSDPRKTNLQALVNSVLGGTRITTVDVPKWMQIEAREVLERELKPLGGIREYEKLYAPDLAKLDPETVAQLSVLNEVQKELSKLNKARKEAEARK